MINKDSAAYWFQYIKGEANVPKTVFVPYYRDRLSDLSTPVGKAEYGILFYEVERACETIGYPCFIRTDITSAKHAGIDAVKVTATGDLNVPLLKTLEHAELKAIWGPALYSGAIMVREWLDLDASFTAFDGLPIAKEFRLFVSQEGVECIHPYWPKQALEGRTDDPDWETKLEAMQAQKPSLMVSVQAQRIVQSIGQGTWSMDYALGTNGTWYLTDMATAVNSYHQPHQ